MLARSIGRRAYKPRDPGVTSAIMSAVRGRENRAEATLRKALWSFGLRYRLYRKDLIGRPDLTFVGPRVVVFVDGDYWHGRALKTGGEAALREVIRGPRFDWWRDKLARNIARDARVSEELAATGWTVIRVWESDVLKDCDAIAGDIARVVMARRRERAAL